MFHLMPYRDLPADFAQRYKSAYIDPLWFDVADPEKVSQYYNWTLDEFVYAARSGMHGLCTNQHHQNVYGFMANPSLMGSVLAKLTNGQNVAIIQLGSTLPSTSPPTRIAEEYALIDCISGGRLVAGFPTGLPTDATISNAVVPVEKRGRDANPYRLGFLQLVGVSETDAQAQEYAPHVEYFFHKLLYTPSYYQAIPGYQDYPSMLRAMKAPLRERFDVRDLRYKDFIERGFLIAGSPATVRDQLIEGVKRLRIGHLLALLHFGSMPHELCLKNIDLFCREVLPHLEPLWDDQWEDRWWPARLRNGRSPAKVN